jgi:hypothetical protein
VTYTHTHTHTNIKFVYTIYILIHINTYYIKIYFNDISDHPLVTLTYFELNVFAYQKGFSRNLHFFPTYFNDSKFQNEAHSTRQSTARAINVIKKKQLINSN